MEIYLIRHTSVDVPAGYAYGQTDVPLKASFTEEADRVRQALDGHTFDQVWSSPLSRCRRLAAYCGYPDPMIDSRLMEVNFGEWEMKSWDEVSSDSRSVPWFDDWLHEPTPGGESFADQCRRVSSFLEDLRCASFRKVLLFAHGGVLTAARVYAGEYPVEEAFKHLPSYGEMIRIEI